MTRRVAVVGMSGIFPTGQNLDNFKHKLFSNQSLIRAWDVLEAYPKQLRSKVAGFVSEDECNIEVIRTATGYPEIYLDKLKRIPTPNLATADLGGIWAMLASQDAIRMANWTEDKVQSPRTGVVIGSGGGGHTVLRHAWDDFFHHHKKSRTLSSHNVDRTMAFREAANVSCLIHNQGVCESIGSACACGLGNIGYAIRLIQFGLQDRVIAGGVEGTSIETFLGFDAMCVLSRRFAPEQSSRPFDKDRDGFVCSFGCGIVALEEYEAAKQRGAKILGVIDGYFNNCDGDGDMFAPAYNGQLRLWQGLRDSMDTELRPDVVNTHSTSTPTGDAIELFATVKALGPEGYHIAAPKSQFGHMLGAAGAVEFIVSLLMLQTQKVTPCLNSDNLNPELEEFQKAESWTGSTEPVAEYRHLLPQAAFSKPIQQIVSMNYGFGGTNSAVCISKDI